MSLIYDKYYNIKLFLIIDILKIILKFNLKIKIKVAY